MVVTEVNFQCHLGSLTVFYIQWQWTYLEAYNGNTVWDSLEWVREHRNCGNRGLGGRTETILLLQLQILSHHKVSCVYLGTPRPCHSYAPVPGPSLIFKFNQICLFLLIFRLCICCPYCLDILSLVQHVARFFLLFKSQL